MGLLGVIIAAFLCSETLGLVAILAVVGGYAALTQPPRAPSLSARFRSDATALLAICEEQHQVPRLGNLRSSLASNRPLRKEESIRLGNVLRDLACGHHRHPEPDDPTADLIEDIGRIQKQPPGPLSDHTDHASIFRRILDGAERFGRDLRP